MKKSLLMTLPLISAMVLVSHPAFAGTRGPTLLFQCSDGANESDDAQPVRILASRPEPDGSVNLTIIDSHGNRYYANPGRDEFALLSQKKPVPILASPTNSTSLQGHTDKAVLFSFGSMSDGMGPRAYLSAQAPAENLLCELHPGQGAYCRSPRADGPRFQIQPGGLDSSTGLQSVQFLDAQGRTIYSAYADPADIQALLQGKPVPVMASTADGFPIEDSYVHTGIFSVYGEPVDGLNAVITLPSTVSTIHNCLTPAELARSQQAAHSAPGISSHATPPAAGGALSVARDSAGAGAGTAALR